VCLPVGQARLLGGGSGSAPFFVAYLAGLRRTANVSGDTRKETMDRAWLNYIAKRPRINPGDFLKLRPLIPEVKRRRAIPSKRERELAEACLFCHGLSCRMERQVLVIDDRGDVDDHDDYDFVALFEDDSNERFCPIQLKEVVPKRLNPDPHLSVQSVIDGLAKYAPRGDLSVAIRVNRTIDLDLDKITMPPLRIKALWIYGAASLDGSRWVIYGNPIEPEPNLSWFFDYPG
jgi:hypothetical protein